MVISMAYPSTSCWATFGRPSGADSAKAWVRDARRLCHGPGAGLPAGARSTRRAQARKLRRQARARCLGAAALAAAAERCVYVDGGQQSAPKKIVKNRAWLTAHREEIQRQRDRWNRVESRWSWARLLVFLVGVVPWFVWAATPLVPAVVTACAAVLFWWTVRRHLASHAERELRDGMLTVLDEAQQRCGGALEVIRFAERPTEVSDEALSLTPVLDPGPTWSLTDQERDDLDVFAPVGLFGLLNRTSSGLGARRLRDMLDHMCMSPERIVARQKTVHWLEEHPAERIRLMGAAVQLRNEEKRLVGFVRAVHQARRLELFLPVAVLRWWGVVATVLIVFALGHLFVGHFGWGWLLAGVLAVNAVVRQRIGGTLSEALAPWRDVTWGAQGFLIAARQGAADLPHETELAELRECLAAAVGRGKLASLCRRIGWAEHGGGLHVALNYVALYDLHVAAAILKRAVPHREALLTGAAALADLEALASLACFAAEQPVTCYPTPTGEARVEIVDGRHPLIAPPRIVPNSVRLTPEVRMWVVSGSNLAGKSTFLRMVGVNVWLAQIGSAVVAREMSWSPLRLISDLRARDNLAEDESYFLAEVRHLRRMVLPPDGPGVLLGLIDEPFRGTNSEDQSAASVAVLKHLLESSNLVLLATHDRHLTELADGAAVRNFHFREDLSSAGMVFDYHLYDGPARTRNALRVLEREGYPPRILADAQAWLSQSTEEGSWDRTR